MNLSRLTESLAGRLVRKFLADQAPNWAVIIAWSALFSLFPMILVMAAAIGFVLGFVGVESARVYTLVLSIIPGCLNSPAAALALQLLLGVAAGCLLFGAIYYVVPNRRQELRKVWPGSLVAGVLFELLTLLFPLYLRLTGSSNTYGKTFGLVF